MITIEFILSFAATAAIIYLLSAALLEVNNDIRETVADHHRLLRIKEAARTIEIWMYNGQASKLVFQDIYFRVEKTLLVDHPEGIIEIEGVFLNDPREPV
ncbi:hypothetical protein JXA56_02540 [Candidatus Micrarchaeota archaeon]|nr:hypothetical protein [Candidatus Micrarchaeota archaeon]